MNFKKLVAAISLLGTLATSAAFAAAPTYPFGARLDPYVYGIKPNHVTPAQMDNTIKAGYNAQRNPWRWGTDYVLSGDTRWKGVLTKMMNFFVAKTAGNPNNLGGGYQLERRRHESGLAFTRPGRRGHERCAG